MNGTMTRSRHEVILPKIAAVATATPPHRFTQMQLLTMAGYTDAARRGFFERSDIDGRFLFVDPDRFAPNETLDELQARFRRGALEIGEVAARRALERARRARLPRDDDVHGTNDTKP